MVNKTKYLIGLLLIFLLALTSCGGFIAEESLVIQGMNYTVLPDGTTQVVITYTDEEIQPLVLNIPKGANGNGISQIYQYQTANKDKTMLSISFTDGTSQTLEIQNGVSISNIASALDKDGNTVLTVTYSDGTIAAPIIIQKGDKGDAGKDGVTLVDYYSNINDDGSQTIIFTYSDESKYTINIPAPSKGEKGDSGVGITGIVGQEDDTYYYVTIYFTEGEPTILRFNKPLTPDAPNTWLNGASKPTNDIGVNGDYYYDTAHNTIYLKTNGEWNVVIDFHNEDQYYKVTFNLNDKADGGVEAELSTTKTVFDVKNGYSFYSSDIPMPVAYRSGYTFGGWYVVKDPSVVNGAFTDITPVTSNMTLYAYWIKK